MSARIGLTLATEVERHHQGGLAVKEEFSFYVGVDWGVEFHQARILDANGEKICQRAASNIVAQACSSSVTSFKR